MFIDGRPPEPDGQAPSVQRNAITPGYIEAMNISLLAGRTISRQDSVDATPAVVVNDTIVKRYFAGMNPLGQRIRLARNDTTAYTIVGVVKEVKYNHPAAPPENQAYLAFEQSPTAGMCVVIQAHNDPAPLAQSIRSVVRETDPNQPVSEIKTIAAQLADRVAGDRIVARSAPYSDCWLCSWRRSESTASWPIRSRSAPRRSACEWPSAPAPATFSP
jgi:hypothetical protein